MKVGLGLMVLVAGAAGAAELVGTEKMENGFEQKIIDCSGPEAAWGDCYALAKEQCAGRGYSIVDRAERMRAEVQVQTGPAGVVSSTSSEVSRVLTISCATR